MKYVDVLENELNVGDYVAYAALGGRSAIMKVAKILELTQGKRGWGEKVVPKLRVISVDWFFDRWQKQKAHTLGFLDRLVQLQPGQIPTEIKRMLDEPCKPREN